MRIKEQIKSIKKKGNGMNTVISFAHAIKNLDKVIEKCEEEEEMYSGRPSFESGSMRGSYADGMDGYSRGYSREGSYRGRMYARRDSMGRYSGNDEITSQLEDLMRSAPDDRTRQKIQEIMSKM